MAKPIITIDKFHNGIASDNTGGQNGFATIYNCDIYSFPGLITVPRYFYEPYVITNFTGDILCFETYCNSVTSVVYEFAQQAESDIYMLSGAPLTWNLIRNLTGAIGMRAFGNSLFYVNTFGGNNVVGRLNGDPTVPANWTDNYLALLSAPMASDRVTPLISFAGALFVGYGRYVGRLEADEITWNNAALTLPADGNRVTSMTAWNDRLVIATMTWFISTGGNVSREAFIYFWDGVSSTYEKRIELPGDIEAVYNFNETLYAFVQGSIYMYNGSDFVIYKKFSSTGGTRVNANTVINDDDFLLFGTSSIMSPDIGGIYCLGRRSAEFPLALSILYAVNSTFSVATATRITAFKRGYASLYVAYVNAGGVGASLLGFNRKSNESFFVTDSYETGVDDGVLVKGVGIDFNGALIAGGATVVVKYRLDENVSTTDFTTNWTTLETFNDTNYKDIMYGVYKKAKIIQFRFDLVSAAGATPPYIRRIMIY
jgi:hypothetical protein